MRFGEVLRRAGARLRSLGVRSGRALCGSGGAIEPRKGRIKNGLSPKGNGPVRVDHNRHIMGIFARETWMSLMRGAGFTPRMLSDPWNREVFVGTRS